MISKILKLFPIFKKEKVETAETNTPFIEEGDFVFKGDLNKFDLLTIPRPTEKIYLNEFRLNALTQALIQTYPKLTIQYNISLGELNQAEIELIFAKKLAEQTALYRQEINTPEYKASVEAIKKAKLKWDYVINPNGYTEVMLWLKYHKDPKDHPKGKMGESLLHWGVLSNLALTIELIDICGYDPNIKDKNGLTPLDWLMERFMYAVLQENEQMPKESKYKILKMTETNGIFLYEKGGRSTYNLVDLLVKGGAREFVANIYRNTGLSAFTNIGQYKANAFHSWVLLTGSQDQEILLKDLLRYGLDINQVDEGGRTPLFYCVDSFICKPQYYLDIWKDKLLLLLKNGADPNIRNSDGYTVYDLFDQQSSQECEMLDEFKRLVRELC